MLDNALKRGKLSIDQHTVLMGRLKARYEEGSKSMATVATAAGSTRAGMQQLSYQLNDVATMFAMGARPTQIFASQIGQVTQSVQLMGGGASKFAAFLGGPWGMALTTATFVLAPFVTKLFETHDALDLAETGSNALADAQSALGNVFDTVSGKLKTQNELLLLNARLTASNMRAQALAEKESSRDAFANAGYASSGSRAAGAAATGLGLTGKPLADWLLKTNRPVQNLGRLAQEANKIKKNDERRARFDEILKISEKLDFSGSGVDKKAFKQAIMDAASSRYKNRIADLIDQSLDSGSLAKELRTPDKSKPKKDRSAEYQSRYLNELDNLQADQRQLQGQLTTDLRTRAQLQHEQISADRDSYNASVDQRVKAKELTKAQGEQLKLAYEANAAKRDTATNWELDDKLTKEENRQKLALLDMRAEQLQYEYAAAQTEAERRAVALKLLDVSMEKLRISQQEVLDLHSSSLAEQQTAQAKLAQIGQIKAMATQQINRQNAGPLARYLDSLPKTAQQANEAYQAAAADGLASFNDGLAAAITGTKSLGDVFKNVTNQIIADLARIMIQRSITEPLANALFGGGGGGGLFGSLFGGGGGGGLFGSLLGGAKGPPLGSWWQPDGARASGGDVRAMRPYIVGEQGPELMVPGASGTIIPNDRLRAAKAGGVGTGDINVTVNAQDAVLTHTVKGWVAQGVQIGIAQHDERLGKRRERLFRG
ncbi:phage tail length tape measure family protein [Stakelama marina]|uniref:Phage tail length tape measure family protein n=1 Tax=Stakelama marina TaxID=2826939 RepID=A0A8T4IHQ2_9SPHN|nr:phage tail tape measure C-terminal domain-containing protein [Stakelama marina]MBR0551736.1 phage tail length tape measure family protein [Stakelama marina]